MSLMWRRWTVESIEPCLKTLFKTDEAHLTDVWIEVSLSEPMILLDEKLKEAHQAKMHNNTMKLMTTKWNRMEQNLLDLRPAIGTVMDP